MFYLGIYLLIVGLIVCAMASYWYGWTAGMQDNDAETKLVGSRRKIEKDLT